MLPTVKRPDGRSQLMLDTRLSYCTEGSVLPQAQQRQIRLTKIPPLGTVKTLLRENQRFLEDNECDSAPSPLGSSEYWE